jgi:hypothetical protein
MATPVQTTYHYVYDGRRDDRPDITKFVPCKGNSVNCIEALFALVNSLLHSK